MEVHTSYSTPLAAHEHTSTRQHGVAISLNWLLISILQTACRPPHEHRVPFSQTLLHAPDHAFCHADGVTGTIRQSKRDSLMLAWSG
jgi:hypothetical protein